MPDKERERFYITQFLKTQPKLADNKAEAGKPPAPDFIMQIPNGFLGLEVTEFHLPAQPGSGPDEGRKNLIRKTVDAAKKKFRNFGGPVLLVNVVFHDSFQLAKKEIPRFAEDLAEAVRKVSPPRKFEDGRVNVPSLYLPKGVVCVSLFGGVYDGEEDWEADTPDGWVLPITAEHVQKKIDQKSEKYPGYARCCGHTWLVIVLDCLRGPSVEISSEVLSAKYSAPFDRLFLLSPHSTPSTRELHKVPDMVVQPENDQISPKIV